MRRTKDGTEIVETSGGEAAENGARSPRVTGRGTEIIETEPAPAEAAPRDVLGSSGPATRPPDGETAPIETGLPDPKREAVEVLRERVRAHQRESAAPQTVPLNEPKAGSLEVVTTEPLSAATATEARAPSSPRSRPGARRLAPAAMLVVGFVALASGGTLFYLGRRGPSAASPASVAGEPTAPSVSDVPAAASSGDAAPATAATASAGAAASSGDAARAAGGPRSAPPAGGVTTVSPFKSPGPPKQSTPAKIIGTKPSATAAPGALPEEKPRRTRLPVNPRPKTDRLDD